MDYTFRKGEIYMNTESTTNSIAAEDTSTLGEGAVKVWNLSNYLRNTVLNPENLFPDPLFEQKLWYAGAYNQGGLIYDGTQIILDGRAEGKGYTRQALKFDVSEGPYVFEIEMMLLDSSFPVSYPITVNLFDAENNNLTQKPTIYPSAAQLQPNKWHKVRAVLHASEGAVKCLVLLGISDTGGYLAYRRPKLVKGTDTGVLDKFDFDLNDRVQSIADTESAAAETIDPLYGKSVLFAGDSIVANANSYAKAIPAKSKMVVKDLSVPGLNLARNSAADNWNILGRVVDNISTDDKLYDYVILEGGINDMFNRPLGEITTGYTDALDETTYCGALESLLRQCLIKYIGKHIGFVITHQLGNQYNTALGLFFDKARQICEKYSVPYLDLYKASGLCCAIPEVQQALFGTDVIHPNADGHALLTSKVGAWMRTL